MGQDNKTEAGGKEKGGFSPPAISLPKGGGAIRGIGEKFAANPVTGTGSMTVPIATSPGRSGFGPQLSLSYDSGAGNGPFGFGWSLSLPQITRKTDKGLPQYRDAEESDVFILSGAEDLVPVYRQDPDGSWVQDHPVYRRDPTGSWVRNQEGHLVIHEDEIDGYRVHRYRPRIEGLFARIERWSRESDGDVHWRSISKDNILTLYGKDADSRIYDPEDPSHIFSWLICETRDDKGNAVIYLYRREDGAGVDLSQAHERNRGDRNSTRRQANRYLKRIHYGNRVTLLNNAGQRPRFLTNAQLQAAGWMFEVVFDYDDHEPASPKPRDDEAKDAAGALKYPWKPRQDPFSTYRAGFEVRTYRLCQRVLMFHHFPTELGTPDYLVRSTDFTYSYEDNPKDSQNPIYSFIDSVSQSGYKRQANGTYLKRSLPPLEFEYTKPEVQAEVRDVDPRSLENLPCGLDGARYQWVDLDGEGLSGILTEQTEGWFYKRNLSPVNLVPDNGGAHAEASFAPVELVAKRPSLAAISSGAQQLLDLAGDGQLDLVALSGPMRGFFERTNDEGWEPFKPFASLPNVEWNDPNLKFVDLTGDGHADVLITEDEVFSWYPSLAEAGFGREERVSQNRDEEKGPQLVFADTEHSIHLADLSGDGLSDIVRIRNGEVCYWPNLGYGRFGCKVTMDRSPWFDNADQFDPRRIQLADIDGSGTTDIIYLGRGGVDLYFNQSGNSWSNPRRLDVYPQTDNLSSVTAMDLLGTGTACLVWSSPLPGNAHRPMRYLDLMGANKPHLLVRTANNLGAETKVEYAPSTKFYVADKLAGKPWITRIPFPVHMVERVETYDYISRNRFVTRYAYHHGCFDGEEREFRGFGMVEQWDTEKFAALSSSDAFPTGNNIDVTSHVPAVRTKTWFHTGIYLGRDHVSDFFAGLLDAEDKGDYYREPGLTDQEAANLGLDDEGRRLYDDARARTLLLPDTLLPPGLTLEEEHEACRALKGAMLRQEVYADDAPLGSSEAIVNRAMTPYTVTEQNFTIECLQSRGENRHALFFTHAREALTYHYERDPADPRVQHGLTLEVDPFGNILKSAAIGYGRRMDAPDAALLPQDREKQRLIHITCTENTFTNAIANEADVYRTPLPAESRTYELRKPQQEKSGNEITKLYRFDAMLDNVNQAADGNHEVDYEDIEFTKARQAVANDANEGRKYFRRLIEHVRTLYRPDDLGVAQNDPLALLPLETLESLALPGESYKLAFTAGLIDQVFKRDGQALIPDPDEVLRVDVAGGRAADRGGYVELDGDGNWWIPSGRIFYSADTSHNSSQELACARLHFFLPRRYRDPFHISNTWHTETFVDYDALDLLVLETRDALGNRVTAGERDIDPSQPLKKQGSDYRVLQSRFVMDPNRNCTEVMFDALGLVVGTAVMGKPEDNPARGDQLDAGFKTDLTDAETLDHLANPLADPHAILSRATTRLVYDLFAYQRTKDQPDPQPSVAYTLARETHDADLVHGNQTKIQHSFSHSDGFAREIQKKIQAEPGEVDVEDAAGNITVVDTTPNLRWVGSGWTVFNNKGKPVRQYEPFFSTHHQFQFGKKVGVSPILFYDPVERAIATLHPNHTYEKVVFDPWQQTTWDVNDTVLGDPRTDNDVKGFFLNPDGTSRLPAVAYLPTWYALRSDPAHSVAFAARYPGAIDRVNEASAAAKAASHANTPTTAYFDTVGRPFLTVAHNKVVCPNHALDGTEDKLHTRVLLDIEGNQREVHDAIEQNGDKLGRVVMHYDYDMLGNRVHQASMEAGERWMLNDVAGKPVRAWDSRRFLRRMTYDVLRRPIGLFVTENGTERLAEKIVYGEAQGDAANHRTRVYQVRDGAGIVTSVVYDFKGNLQESSRDLLPDYKQEVNWNQNLTANGGSFTSHTTYDALNRPRSVTTPDNSVIRHVYNEANLLDRADANLRGAAVATHFVTNINYNAKGQRELIEYGCGAGPTHNGVTTTYEYDKDTFRLTHLKTTRPAGLNGLASQLFADSTVVQDLRYTYDPAGNITRIADEALKSIFHNNEQVDPVCSYTYDAIYRLIEAKGREHIGQTAHDFNPPDGNRRDYPFAGLTDFIAHPNDTHKLRNYAERYEYDAVGNFDKMRHTATNGDWTRTYEYKATSLIEPAKKSNRLTRTTLGNGLNHAESYAYTDAQGNDVHGCMTAINSMTMVWDFKDQLQATTQQVVTGGGTPEMSYYAYDAAGQRVRKVTESTVTALEAANGKRPVRVKERIYIGAFEIYHEYENDGVTPKLERESLHIMDDKQRIALVETKTIDKNVPAATLPEVLIRHQFSNHLGSASLELDIKGEVISYEEFYPYGSTSYQAVRKDIEVPLKRYRYTGKERDEETGLYYHGARYYAPWLGRWTSCDPAGLSDGPNMYRYVKCCPICFSDEKGKQAEKRTEHRKAAPKTDQSKLGLYFFEDYSSVHVTDKDVTFYDKGSNEFLRLTKDTFAKILGKTGGNISKAMQQMTSSAEFREWLVKEYYKGFKVTGGNPKATNEVGGGTYNYRPSRQELSGGDTYMQCFYTSYFFMLKSVGVIPPDMSAREFERAYSNLRGGPTVAPVFTAGKLGFPGAAASPESSVAVEMFVTSSNAIAVNSEWARFTGMSEKHFKAKDLHSTYLTHQTVEGKTTYTLRESVDVAEVMERFKAGQTIHIGSSDWMHHVLATSPNLIDNPLSGEREPRGRYKFWQATKIFALWAE